MDKWIAACTTEVALQGRTGCALHDLWTHAAAVLPPTPDHHIKRFLLTQLLTLDVRFCFSQQHAQLPPALSGYVLEPYDGALSETIPSSNAVWLDSTKMCEAMSIDQIEAIGPHFRLVAPPTMRDSALGVRCTELSPLYLRIVEIIGSFRTAGTTQMKVSEILKEERGAVDIYRPVCDCSVLQPNVRPCDSVLLLQVMWLCQQGHVKKKLVRENRINVNSLTLSSVCDPAPSATAPTTSDVDMLVSQSLQLMESREESLVPDLELRETMGLQGKANKGAWEKLKAKLSSTGKVIKVNLQVPVTKKRKTTAAAQPDTDGSSKMQTVRCHKLLPVEKNLVLPNCVASLSMDNQIIKAIYMSGSRGLLGPEIHHQLGIHSIKEKKRCYKEVNRLTTDKLVIPILESQSSSKAGCKAQTYRLIAAKYFEGENHYSAEDLQLMHSGSTNMLTAAAEEPVNEGAIVLLSGSAAAPAKRGRRDNMYSSAKDALGASPATHSGMKVSATFMERRSFIMQQLVAHGVVIKNTLASLLTSQLRVTLGNTHSTVDRKTVTRICEQMVKDGQAQEMECQTYTGKLIYLLARPELTREQVEKSDAVTRVKTGGYSISTEGKIKARPTLQTGGGAVVEQVQQAAELKRKIKAPGVKVARAVLEERRIVALLYGWLPGQMQRAKAFHQFAWQLSRESAEVRGVEHVALSEDIPSVPEHTLYFDSVIDNMNIKLYLQVIGLNTAVDGLQDCLKRNCTVAEAPEKVRQQLITSAGKLSIKKILNVLSELQLVTPAQLDPSAKLVTFKYIHMRQRIQLELPDSLPTFDFPTAFDLTTPELLDHFWSTFEFLTTRTYEVNSPPPVASHRFDASETQKKPWLSTEQWGAQQDNFTGPILELLEQRREVGLPQTPAGWIAFAKQVKVSIVGCIRYFRKNPHPKPIPTHLQKRTDLGTQNGARQKGVRQKKKAAKEKAAAAREKAAAASIAEPTAEALEGLGAEKAPRRAGQRIRWSEEQDKLLIGAWAAEQVRTIQTGDPKVMASYIKISQSVEGKSNEQSQKRIAVLRRREPVRYAMDQRVVQELHQLGIEVPDHGDSRGEHLRQKQPNLLATSDTTLAKYSFQFAMKQALSAKTLAEQRRDGLGRLTAPVGTVPAGGLHIPWSTLSCTEQMATDFALQVISLPDQLYTSQVTSKVHQVASGFGHTVLTKVFDLLKASGLIKKKKASVASRGLFYRAYSPSPHLINLLSRSAIPPAVFAQASRFSQLLRVDGSVQPDLRVGGNLAVCLAHISHGTATVTTELLPDEDNLEEAAARAEGFKPNRGGVGEYLLRADGKDIATGELPLEDPVFEFWHRRPAVKAAADGEPNAEAEVVRPPSQAEDSSAEAEDGPEACSALVPQLEQIAVAISMSSERKDVLIELLQTIIAAGSEGVDLRTDALRDGGELEALGLVKQLQFTHKWVAVGCQLDHCAGTRLPWLDPPEAILHTQYTDMTRVRLVSIVFKRPGISRAGLHRLVPVMSPTSVDAILELLETDGAIVTRKFIKKRPSLFSGPGQMMPAPMNHDGPTVTLFFPTIDCISRALNEVSAEE